MKKLLNIAIFVFICSIFTSCSDVKYNLEINEDGSANFSYILSVNEDIYEDYASKYKTTLEKLEEELRNAGFSVNESFNNDEKVFEAKLYIDDIKNIDSFNTVLLQAIEGEPIVSYSKNIFLEKYKINAKIDLVDYNAGTRESKNDEYVEENLGVTFNLKVPVSKVSSSNANVDNGNFLTWNLKYNHENTINVEYNIINIYAVAGAIILAFILAQIIVILIVMKIIKKRSSEE